MNTVLIQTAQPYAVHIGAGLIAHSGELTAAVTSARRCALVTDSTVAPLYAQKVIRALESAGFTVHLYTLPAGEEHKTLTTLAQLLSFFAQSELTRTDLAVALGGGVVGDMTGFACAVYQRGIDFVQMPTTLLAACDASVGVKTAVDLPEGKNLAGAFHQPRLVICDTDTFATLPDPVLNEGMAEVIKHALIADKELFSALQTQDVRSSIVELVRRNIEIKASFVCGDEREHGQRKLLNFGHTLAHAVERCSNYTTAHGEAVAIGMTLICRASEKAGYSPAGTTDIVRSLLRRFSLPCDCPFTAGQLFNAATADKKRAGDSIDIVILEEIGRAKTLRLTLEQLREFTEAAL
ncbi:MAG: 3-dehydroquinate synthase [Oscillospiraceae bacterium]|nr:3-dehydroquinate synthase [Oscillospiraceae bacterium]